MVEAHIASFHPGKLTEDVRPLWLINHSHFPCLCLHPLAELQLQRIDLIQW